MLTLIGIIAVLAGIAMIVLSFVVVKEDVVKDVPDRWDPDIIKKEVVHAKSPDVLLKLAGIKKGILTLVLGLVIAIIPSTWDKMFFTAHQGMNYYVQYPFGGTAVHTTKIGLAWKGFGTVTSFKDFFTVSTTKGSSSHVTPIDIAFADKETALQPITYRIETPQDPEGFEEMVVEFRTQANLIRSITPKVQEVVSNTAFMFTGQGYTSGEAPAFNQAVRDQLALGSYVLVAERNKGTKNKLLNADSLKVLVGQTGPVLKRIPKLDEHGKVVRVTHSFMRSGLSITNVSLPKADFSPEFDKRMAAQRKQSGDFQNSILERKTIIEKTKLAEAKGEQAKTVERLAQEKAAVAKITAANTKLLQDSIVLAQVKIAKEVAKVKAATLKINKDAESYAVKKMNIAGIDPVVKYKMELNAKVKIEEARAKTKWPVYYMPGGNSNSNKALDVLMYQTIKGTK